MRRRSLGQGEVLDLAAGETVVLICQCGALRNAYTVENVTEKTAVVVREPSHGWWRIKRERIFYSDSKPFGEHFRVRRPAPPAPPKA